MLAAPYNPTILWMNLILRVIGAGFALWAGKHTMPMIRPMCAMVALMCAVKVGGYLWLVQYPQHEVGWNQVFRGVAMVEAIIFVIIPMWVVGTVALQRERAIQNAEDRANRVLGDGE